MSNEKINPLNTTNNSLSPKLRWLNNSKRKKEFKVSCLKQDKLSFTLRNVVNLFIVYVLDTWSQDLNTDFILKDCLFGAFELTKNADPDKYSYSRHGIWFHSFSPISLPNFHGAKNAIIFGVGNSSSVYIDKKIKHTLVVGKDPTQGLDDTIITAEVENSIKFWRSKKQFCLSLHYKRSNSFLFVHATKICQF